MVNAAASIKLKNKGVNKDHGRKMNWIIWRRFLMLLLQWQPLRIGYLTTLRLTITSKTCIMALLKRLHQGMNRKKTRQTVTNETKERVLEDAEDDDNDSDHEPKTLHLPDGNGSNGSDNEIDDELKGSNEDEEYSDEDEDEDE
jgi:hypothetical protein